MFATNEKARTCKSTRLGLHEMVPNEFDDIDKHHVTDNPIPVTKDQGSTKDQPIFLR